MYLKGEYNETQHQREFVNPLSVPLGGMSITTRDFPRPDKDVIHEQTIKFRGHDTNTRFIDYAFRLGGVMKYIIETKNSPPGFPTMQGLRSRSAVMHGMRNSHSISSPILKNGPSMIAALNPKTMTPQHRAG